MLESMAFLLILSDSLLRPKIFLTHYWIHFSGNIVDIFDTDVDTTKNALRL